MAVISSFNFSDWRTSVAGRMKVKQIMTAFEDVPADTAKYVCAPCSNCKAQLRDLIEHYDLGTKWSLAYTGLAELIVNAMSDLPEGFLP